MSLGAATEEYPRPRNEEYGPGEAASPDWLSDSSPPSSRPVIAVDLDDVLSQTNHVVAEWHNERYGTDMSVSHFYYYYYSKNPYWGTPSEMHAKVSEFYDLGRIHDAAPVTGAREGVQVLHDLGYRLVVVTARNQSVAEESWLWLDKHFPGLFDKIICTGQFRRAINQGELEYEVLRSRSKADVCAEIKAQLLIDDSVENGLDCANAASPTRVLLFGEYEWNKRLSKPEDLRDDMTFERRLYAAGGREFWKDDTVEIPEKTPVWRVKDWEEVVRWVERERREGRI